MSLSSRIKKGDPYNPNYQLFDFDEELPATNEFGGEWTNTKLDVLKRYLTGFTTMFLRQKHWAKTIYIDACAGTGNCTIQSGNKIFTIPGSAKLALDTIPEFDEFVFIEKKSANHKQLLGLKKSTPKKLITVNKGDCNEILPTVLAKLTANHRGVIFIDPFGMNITWAILKAVAATKHLDVWYLFPLSGLYRQAAKDREDVDLGKAKSILSLLGDPDWEKEFYVEEPIQDMHGAKTKVKRALNVDEIIKYVTKRLKTEFTLVIGPLILPNKGPRRYALYYAMSSESRAAQELAKRLASHILSANG